MKLDLSTSHNADGSTPRAMNGDQENRLAKDSSQGANPADPDLHDNPDTGPFAPVPLAFISLGSMALKSPLADLQIGQSLYDPDQGSSGDVQFNSYVVRTADPKSLQDGAPMAALSVRS